MPEAMNQRVTNRVLGIDPGFDRLGLAVLEGDPSRPHHIWSECVSPTKGDAADRLAQVYRAVSDAIAAYAPQAMALETLFFSTNKKTAISVAEARGVVLAAAGAHGLPVLEFSPGQVKLAVTGHGSADKAAIARMLPHLLTLPPKKRLDDEMDAIAIAIAGLATGGYPQR
jgi:crossover junction endodeoxyribonuclease RuvC